MEKKFKVVTVGRGRATHLAYNFIGGNDREMWSIGNCTAVKHGRATVLTNTYMKVELENITCKNCRKRFMEEVLGMKEETIIEAPKKEEKEMTMEEIQAELKKMKEAGKGFTIPK